MLSKFVKATPTAFKLVVRGSKKQNMQLFYRSIYAFGTNPNETPKPQKKLETEFKKNSNPTSKTDASADSFTEYMQEPQKNPPTSYVYTKKEVYSIKSQYKHFAARQRGDFVIMSLMLGASAVSYFYIHPFSVVIPLWFFAGSFISLMGARKMSKSLCKSMELLNHVYVKLQMLRGEELVCKIDEIQILGLKEWNPVKKKTEPTNSYIVLGYFKDIHSKVQREVRFIVDKKVTMIENIDLFRAIMHNDIAEVQKFELKESVKVSRDPKRTQFQFDFSEEEIGNLEQELKVDKKEKEIEKENKS